MRALPVSLLLAASWGLSSCTSPDAKSPTAEAPAAAPLPVVEPTSTSSGETTGGLGPTPDQRPVPLEDVVAADTVYAATLPVLRDAEGTIRLRIAVNPRAHTLEDLRALFTPHGPGVRYRPIGRGIGIYNAKMGRYYFNVGYQRLRTDSYGRTESGPYQEITGWLNPDTHAAAVAYGEPVP